MKKFILLCLVAMTSISTGVAQKVTAKWSEEQDPKKGTPTDNFWVKNGKVFFVSEFGITTADVKTLKILEKHDFKVATKKTTFLEVVMVKGKVWLFTRNTADKVNYVKAYPIDDNGKVIEAPIELAAFKDDKKTFATDNKGTTVIILNSRDSSKIAVVINSNGKEKEKALSYVNVFDTDLKRLWTQVIEFPYIQKQFQVKCNVVTNTGEIQLVTKVYDDQKAEECKSETQAAYKYVICTYSAKNSKGKETAVDLGGKFVGSIYVKTRPDNGNTMIIGLYANKNTNKSFTSTMVLNGFFYTEVAPDGKVANKYTTEINATKIKSISKEILREKENGMTAQLMIKDVFFKKDGSIVVLTEQFYSTFSQQYNSKGQPSGSSTIYHADDNIVLSFDPKGKLKWATDVPKRQAAANLQSSVGARAFFKNDNLFLIYIDLLTNLKKEPDGTPPSTARGVPAVTAIALIASDGKLTRKAFNAPKESKEYVYFRNWSERLNDDEFLYTAVKSRLFNYKYKLVRMKLEP